jgi:hypothetical protein
MRADVDAWMTANQDQGKVHGKPQLLSEPD